MEKLSDHTILINKMIGLSKTVQGWPSTLKDLGYRLEWIEPRFRNSDGHAVNPDLIFTSNHFVHVLITECKSGENFNEDRKRETDDQIKRYKRITTEDIIALVSVYDSRKLTCSVSLTCNPEMATYLSRYGIPLQIFSEDNLSKVHPFNKSELENAFYQDIPLSDTPPVSFYPFSGEHDPDSVIALEIFSFLLSTSFKSNSSPITIHSEEIAQNIQPCWNDIHNSEREKIINKIDKIIDRYGKAELKDVLQSFRTAGSWKITKTTEAFRKKCQEIINKLDDGGPDELGDYFDLYG